MKSAPALPKLLSLRILALGAACLFALIANPAQAKGLRWDAKVLSFDTKPGDEKVEARYPFTNISEQAITILETSTSCGCTVPTLEKKTYAPGESGELLAIFTLGGRTGEQRKTISVRTDEAAASQSYELQLSVSIPVAISFNPRVLFWQRPKSDQARPIGASEDLAKEIDIVLHPDFAMEIDSFRIHSSEQESTSDIPASKAEPDALLAFDIDLITVESGRRYTLRVKPKSLAERAKAVLYLHSENDPSEALKGQLIYLYIR